MRYDAASGWRVLLMLLFTAALRMTTDLVAMLEMLLGREAVLLRSAESMAVILSKLKRGTEQTQ